MKTEGISRTRAMMGGVPALLLGPLLFVACSKQETAPEPTSSNVSHLTASTIPDCTESWCADLGVACNRYSVLCSSVYGLSPDANPNWCGGWVKVLAASLRRDSPTPAAAAATISSCTSAATSCAQASSCPGLALFPDGGDKSGLMSEPYPPEDWDPAPPPPDGGFPKPVPPAVDTETSADAGSQVLSCTQCALDNCPIVEKDCFSVDRPDAGNNGNHTGNIKQCETHRACVASCASQNPLSFPGFYVCVATNCKLPHNDGGYPNHASLQACTNAKCGRCAPNVRVKTTP